MIELAAVEPNCGKTEDPIRAESESLINARFVSYLSDESGFGPGKASVLFIPNSESQVAQFLKEMNEKRIPVTISGGRTGIVAGAVPEGGALLSLDNMNEITAITWHEQSKEWRLTCQPGIRLRDLQQKITTKSFGRETHDSEWKDLPQFLNDPSQYFYPPDPTEDTASLGGTVATDASGARTYLYGRTREHVRAIRIVLPSGEVLDLRRGEHLTDSSNTIQLRHLDGTTTDIPLPRYERPNVKCATGYYSKRNMDLLDLFIGSEGTLGVITSVEIALQKKPQTAMFLAFFSSIDDANAFVIQTRSNARNSDKMSVYSLEYLDSNSLRLLHEINKDRKLGMKLPADSGAAVLSEFQSTDTAIELLIEYLQLHHSPVDETISAIDERDKERLRTLRHSIPEAINQIIAKRKTDIPRLHKLGTDTAVPDERLTDIMKVYGNRLAESRLEHYVIGHIAENHLHVNILPRSLSELETGEHLVRILAQDAVAMGGVVSAEHGIGKMKRNFLGIMFQDEEIEEMIATKRAFDPNWILCRGNIFNE